MAPDNRQRRSTDHSDQAVQIREAFGFIASIREDILNKPSGALTTAVCCIWLWSHFMGSQAQGAAVTKAEVYEIVNDKVAPMASDIATIKTGVAVLTARMDEQRHQ